MNEDVKHELAVSSEHWFQNFDRLNKFWTSAALKPEFWGVGAMICERHGVPPKALIVITHNHLNDNPEDCDVSFHCNVMRAEGLLERAIANARVYLKRQLKYLESVAICAGLSSNPESSIGATYRKVAALGLEMMQMGISVVERRLGRGLEDQVWDAAAYAAADKNPFLLLGAAKTPLARHVAYSSVRALLDYQPWVEPIWEGLVRGGFSLRDEGEMAGPPPDPNPIVGPNWTWPRSLSKPFRVESKPPHPELRLPRLHIHPPSFGGSVRGMIEAAAESRGDSELHRARW